MAPATILAAATLARATRFLAGGMRAEAGAPPRAIEGAGRAKVIGNGLRELDRFLSILIDAVAADTAPAGLDRRRLRRLRNTPNKLRLLHAALARPQSEPDHHRLRAIGHGRDCLFHTAGIVRRTDAAGGLTPGWTRTRYRAGETLPMTARDLAAVCGFYDRLAADLLAAAAARRER